MPLWMIHKILHKNLESSCKPSWRKLTIHRRAAAIDIELFALKKPQQSEYENELITKHFQNILVRSYYLFTHFTQRHLVTCCGIHESPSSSHWGLKSKRSPQNLFFHARHILTAAGALNKAHLKVFDHAYNE